MYKWSDRTGLRGSCPSLILKMASFSESNPTLSWALRQTKKKKKEFSLLQACQIQLPH